MAMVIVLSAADAAHVRGASEVAPAIAALSPFPLIDGRFYLGLEVLSDSLHSDNHDYLATLPQVDLASVANLLPVDSKA
ncbi:MAG TPA: hypothetical protein VGJ56_11240 [Reyranella sp.]